jgi:HSP20 family protein
VSVDIAETGTSLHIKAEVPGFTEKDLEVSVEPQRVTIAGHRETTSEEKKGKTVYSEVRSNRIFRQVHLPATVDPEKVEATLKNGVLVLTMPKAARAPVIRVQPKAA